MSDDKFCALCGGDMAWTCPACGYQLCGECEEGEENCPECGDSREEET